MGITSHIPQKKRWQPKNVLLNTLFVGFFHSLAKEAFPELQGTESEPTRGIYNKETDGWTGHLSAEII